MSDLIFAKGSEGRTGLFLDDERFPEAGPDCEVPDSMKRGSAIGLPEVDEVTAVRHYTELSRKNFGVDLGIYPLGSCTMKYNPKINEQLADDADWTRIHPLQPHDSVQGCLKLIWNEEKLLCRIFGMDAFSLQPAAGAHGELTGLMMIKAYHGGKGENRSKVLVPDSAHGTNPASAAMCGFEVVEVKSNDKGNVDLDDLRRLLSTDVAALMMTNPNTLGLFEKDILEIAAMVHGFGALLYYDGANANAIMGKARPGDMGFDVMHVNLHKTFSTPHGGGGPGSGPVGARGFMADYLPIPRIIEGEGEFDLGGSDRFPLSIGKVRSFYGNFPVILKAYAYIIGLGGSGLTEVSELAVLNANYLKSRLAGAYKTSFDRVCKHEFVISAAKQKEFGVRASDIAKKLLDYGIHAPTIYFPLIVPEALMIEPTETESKESLDCLAEALLVIAESAKENPGAILEAPLTTPVRRLDEALAARRPDVCYKSDI